jgi:hypothetical protein
MRMGRPRVRGSAQCGLPRPRPATNAPMDFARDGDLATYFPVESQSVEDDKRALIGALLLARRVAGRYRYLEVGSFLGGSLAPFLMDPCCLGVLSVDERNRAQPDERGMRFDYAGISAATMIDGLHATGVDTTKLVTFDGAIDALPTDGTRYDLAFVDAEHTDEACFRDALWTRSRLASDAALLFHDTRLVFKALRLLAVHFVHAGTPFRIHKTAGSDVTAFLFGAFMRDDAATYLGPADDFDGFCSWAERYRIETQVRNRVRIEGVPDDVLRKAKLTVVDPPVVKAY